MSSEITARVFYCADCGNRSRCQPLRLIVSGVRIGARKLLTFELELCPPCKVGWIGNHLDFRAPGRRSYHETQLQDARLSRGDVEDLQEVQQWRGVLRAAH